MATALKLAAVPTVQRPGRLLKSEEASEFLGVPVKTLAQWRSQNRGPRFIKFEERLVRYRLMDLEEYVLAHIVETEKSDERV